MNIVTETFHKVQLCIVTLQILEHRLKDFHPDIYCVSISQNRITVLYLKLLSVTKYKMQLVIIVGIQWSFG